jgi:hypothetical protein
MGHGAHVLGSSPLDSQTRYIAGRIIKLRQDLIAKPPFRLSILLPCDGILEHLDEITGCHVPEILRQRTQGVLCEHRLKFTNYLRVAESLARPHVTKRGTSESLLAWCTRQLSKIGSHSMMHKVIP